MIYFLRVVHTQKPEIVSDILFGSVCVCVCSGTFMWIFHLIFFLPYTLTFYLIFYLESFQGFILALFLASILTLSLTFVLAFYLIFSGVWLRSSSAHSDLTFAIKGAAQGCQKEGREGAEEGREVGEGWDTPLIKSRVPHLAGRALEIHWPSEDIRNNSSENMWKRSLTGTGRLEKWLNSRAAWRAWLWTWRPSCIQLRCFGRLWLLRCYSGNPLYLHPSWKGGSFTLYRKTIQITEWICDSWIFLKQNDRNW